MIPNGIYVFIIAGLILIVFGLSFRKRTNYNLVPRKIWTYLENSDNRVHKLCIDSWRKHNPDYEVIVLTRNTFKGYVTIPPKIYENPVFGDRISELVRVWVLAENGGVWIEPTVLLKEPLDNWLFKKYGELSGFYSSTYTKYKEFPVIENWFIACNKNSKFMGLWRDEYSEIIKYPNIEKYIDSRRRQIDFGYIKNPIDMAQYIAVQKVLQIDKYSQDSIILRISEEGPMKYLVKAKWDSEKAINLACSDKEYQSPIMRMRPDEFNELEKSLDYKLTIEECGWLD